jgi:phosphatidate phosphatase APP1
MMTCLALAGALATLAGAEIKPNETVVFYPAPGWRSNGVWVAEVHGCVYELEKRNLAIFVLRRTLGFDDDEMSAAELALFSERARLLMVDHQGDRTVRIQLAGREHHAGPSASNGHFIQHLVITNRGASAGGDERLRFEARLNGGRAPVQGEAHLLATNGTCVVSDIDDTIKVSRVQDRHELMRNTFYRPFAPVPGMAETYRAWARGKGVAFHYVSASPWQLYPPLAEFVRSNGFPAGTFHLKHVRVKDGTILDLFDSPEEHKLAAIGQLMERFPGREFVLVGDSGERDPEIYAELARRHTGQVRRILIRNVTSEGRDAPRYGKTFAGLPNSLWRVFDAATEVRSELGSSASQVIQSRRGQ